MPTDPAEIQAGYYRQTAETYEKHHCEQDFNWTRAVETAETLLRELGARTVLDVGCGTGRIVKHLRGLGYDAHGVEPIRELVQQNPEIAPYVEIGRAERLPFPDASFDVVLEVAVLHHVAHPEHVIAEMLRVAKHAVIIADANRFGQGSIAARLAKLALYRLGLWSALVNLRTAGKGYFISEGDGLFYSYSVFDNLRQLRKWGVVSATGGILSEAQSVLVVRRRS